MDGPDVEYRIRPTVTNDELNALFSEAWPDHRFRDFAPVLTRSLGYVCAYHGGALIGFANVAWDGGAHAFLLDTTVRFVWRRRGVGVALVRRAAAMADEGGAAWLHVDFEAGLNEFHRRCGFRTTAAGLMGLGVR